MKTAQQQQMVMQVLASMNINTLSPPETVKMEALENAISHGYQLGLSMGAATGRAQWEDSTFMALFTSAISTSSPEEAFDVAEKGVALLKARAEEKA